MNRLPDTVITAEGKANVRYAATHFGARKIFLNPTSGIDEVDGIVVVLLNARSDCKNIRVKNDIFCWEVNFIY
jgi:hypothetical protein